MQFLAKLLGITCYFGLWNSASSLNITIYVCSHDISVMHKVKLQIFLILLIKNMKHIFMLPDNILFFPYSVQNTNIKMIWHSFIIFQMPEWFMLKQRQNLQRGHEITSLNISNRSESRA